MGKQKFNPGDNVKIVSGRKALVGICGYIRDCLYSNEHILYYVADFRTNKVVGTFYSSNLKKLDEIIITPENFDDIASYCVNKNIRGWFINDEGPWMCVTPEDFGNKCDGNYITNGITIFKDGKTSIGGKIVKFIPESTFEYTSVDMIKSVQEEAKEKMKQQTTILRHLDVSIEDAREWYGKGGELKKLALKLYSEDELKACFPKSWEEYCKTTYEKELYFITQTGIKREIDYGKQLNPAATNSLPTEKLAKAHSAFMQLSSLYWSWYGGWTPGTSKRSSFYSINYDPYYDKISTQYHTVTSTNKSKQHLFWFPTKKDAIEFINNFKHLFENIKYLIAY